MQHLIIDYGLVESDGDDIQKLQNLSSIIFDLAIAVYGSLEPQSAQVLWPLRKEVKRLAELLISFENDDRLVTSSFAFTSQELERLLAKTSYVEVKKNTIKNLVLIHGNTN